MNNYAAIEVIFACNGCTDRKVEIVNNLGKPIKCIVTATASKARALNLGDDVAMWFPRIYQDADVILALSGLEKTCKALSGLSMIN